VNEAATVAHLTPLACELLQEPDERRIRAILGERWVLYPRAKQALDVLNRLAAHPRTTRMPSVAIYGDSGMGKTMIMQRFCTDHPARFDFDAGVKRTPVLAL
jgi:predicted ATPase